MTFWTVCITRSDRPGNTIIPIPAPDAVIDIDEGLMDWNDRIEVCTYYGTGIVDWTIRIFCGEKPVWEYDGVTMNGSMSVTLGEKGHRAAQSLSEGMGGTNYAELDPTGSDGPTAALP